jgi:hypothetical protein
LVGVGFVAAVGAAAVGALASESDDEAIKTPLTVTDCEGPVRVILSREQAIAFMEERGDPVPPTLRRNEPPVEEVVIELREGPPGEGTEFAPTDPLHTDC